MDYRNVGDRHYRSVRKSRLADARALKRMDATSVCATTVPNGFRGTAERTKQPLAGVQPIRSIARRAHWRSARRCALAARERSIPQSANAVAAQLELSRHKKIQGQIYDAIRATSGRRHSEEPSRYLSLIAFNVYRNPFSESPTAPTLRKVVIHLIGIGATTG